MQLNRALVRDVLWAHAAMQAYSARSTEQYSLGKETDPMYSDELLDDCIQYAVIQQLAPIERDLLVKLGTNRMS